MDKINQSPIPTEITNIYWVMSYMHKNESSAKLKVNSNSMEFLALLPTYLCIPSRVLFGYIHFSLPHPMWYHGQELSLIHIRTMVLRINGKVLLYLIQTWILFGLQHPDVCTNSLLSVRYRYDGRMTQVHHSSWQRCFQVFPNAKGRTLLTELAEFWD